MSTLEKRLGALERTYGSEPKEDPAELERRREELNAKLERAYEKAKREETEGNPVRRIALEELEEHMRERIGEQAGR